MRVGTARFVGDRLKEAREARGLTCKELAERLGISRSSISNYENALQTPSPQALRALADALAVTPGFFTRPLPPRAPASQFFRSFHSATKRSRAMASRRYEWFREIVAFLNQFVKFPEVDVPDFGPASENVSLEDVEQLAAEVRAHWRLGDRPISNIVWLLENKGVACCRFRFESTSLDAFSEWRRARPFIVLSSDKACCVRSRYDAAHELAHMVLHRAQDPGSIADYSRFSLLEQQADTFASAFLMPASSFANDFSPSLEELRTLKRRWLVSIAAMVKRGRQLNLLSDVQEKNLWRQIARRKWRTREPLDDVLPPEEPEFVRRSVSLLEKRGLSSTRDIAFHLGLTPAETSSLCGVVDHSEPELHSPDVPARDAGQAILRFVDANGR